MKLFLYPVFGGGTGTGATPIIAKYAYELAIRSRVIIVNPFRFEGSKRSQKAQEGIAELKKYTQNIYELHNEDLVMDFDKKEKVNYYQGRLDELEKSYLSQLELSASMSLMSNMNKAFHGLYWQLILVWFYHLLF